MYLNKIIVIRAIEPLFYYAYKGSFLNALMITLENEIYLFKNFKNTNRKIFISIKIIIKFLSQLIYIFL
ncbi:hypothetical protein AVENP_1434 [Arcobacter venerupis]|uniref:Uncharacterized protein n=1 Tax=Arcobacter venerupis TaxID=1054033 RepID=A0AAE7B7T4_9BACT|nr:hypothetical protein AVENP_1434 [Arcobacter venerupis]RWS50063.1 hypothetical protein CKA56_06185 [Arcobacter venerupis]